MNKTDYDIILQDLNDKFNENKEKINELHNKIDIIYKNSFKKKLEIAAKIGSVPFLIMIILNVIMSMYFIIPNSISILNILIPSLTGLIGQRIYSKQSKHKEQLLKITSSTKEAKLIEEKTRHIIDLKKLKQENSFIFYLHQNFKTDKHMLDYKTETYNDDKSVLENNLIITTELRNNYIKEFELMITKKTLSARFAKYRSKISIDNHLFSLVNGIFMMLICSIPEIVNGTGVANIPYFTNVMLASISTIVATNLYLYKDKKDHQKAFININNELEENKLKNYYKYEETKDLSMDYSNLRQNFIVNEKQYKINNRMLNKIENTEDITKELTEELCYTFDLNLEVDEPLLEEQCLKLVKKID